MVTVSLVAQPPQERHCLWYSPDLPSTLSTENTLFPHLKHPDLSPASARIPVFSPNLFLELSPNSLP